MIDFIHLFICKENGIYDLPADVIQCELEEKKQQNQKHVEELIVQSQQVYRQSLNTQVSHHSGQMLSNRSFDRSMNCSINQSMIQSMNLSPANSINVSINTLMDRSLEMSQQPYEGEQELLFPSEQDSSFVSVILEDNSKEVKEEEKVSPPNLSPIADKSSQNVSKEEEIDYSFDEITLDASSP